MCDKTNNLYKPILILGSIVLLIFILDFSNVVIVRARINIEFWSSFISALIGAMVTIYGVYWTISAENRKSKQDLINSNKPCLQYSISIGIYPYRKIDQSKRTAILDYEIEFSQNPNQSLIFPLYVENIGLGHAFIEDIRVDNKKPDIPERKKIIRKDGDSVFYVEIKNISKGEIKNLKLIVYYEDFFGTKYSNTIKVEFAKDGEPVLFDKNSADEALTRYFKKYNINQQKKYQDEIDETIDQGNFIVKGLSYENMPKQEK